MSDLHAPSSGDLLDRLSQRGLLKTAGVYVGSATSAVLFVNFLTQHYGLSPHLVDAAMWLALLALPSVLLTAYCRGGAAPRVQMRKPHKMALGTNGILAAAVLGVGFADKPMGPVSRTVVAEGADGERVERVVATEAFRKRVGAFYLDGPDDEPWLGRAAAYGIGFDLDQSPFLTVETPDDFAERLRRAGYPDGAGVPLALAHKEAARARLDVFVTGTVSRVEEGVRLALRLTDGETGREVDTFDETGRSVLDVADRAATWIRDELDLPADRRADAADLPAPELLTSDDGALEAWTTGFHLLSYDQDVAAAAPHFAQAAEADPSFALAHILLSMPQMQAGDMAGAQASLAAARQHDYRLSESNRHALVFNELFMSQRPDEAYAALKRWAELFPERTDPRTILAMIALNRGDYEVAVTAYEEIIALDPGETEAHLQAASARLMQNRLAAAEVHYQAFADTEPGRADGLRGLAHVKRLQGESEAAIEALRQATLAEPDNTAVVSALGGALVGVGRLEDGLGAYDRAVSMAKTPSERAAALRARAEEVLSLGRTAAALADLDAHWAEQATTTDAASLALAKADVASHLVEHGLEAQADAAVAAAQGHPAVQQIPIFTAVALIHEASVATAEGDGPRALAAIERAATEGAAQGLDLEKLGAGPVLRADALVAAGRAAEAVAVYEALVEEKPSGSGTWRRLGEAQAAAGDQAGAQKSLDRALRLMPANPKAHLALARLLRDRPAEARRHLGAALAAWSEADAGFRPAQEARALLRQLGGTRIAA
ncbi:tetratricopeptide repeat protein [Rubrivirga litoralis]|uniref:Tetratricopeptide repeat protein n=1 Tax=Rubrivirga litoralis TaxID=3075598 RepID=A0ABU3BUY9_9BACT|nr:tetratricopeptide repeat protein [Rubrivirga sp. F394]MDT0633105.1 tetratricopeptide repeat protein [Rubrivirga sp. F394]